MAAPLLAGAGKFIAKQVAAKAAAKAADKASGGGKGGGDQGDDNDTRATVLTVIALVVILVILFAIVQGIIVGMMAPLSGFGKAKGDDFCSVTSAMIDEWDASDTEHGTDDDLKAGGDYVSPFSPVSQLEDLKGLTLSMPLGNVTPRKTSSYGPRIPPKAGASSYHRGVDYGHPEGTPTVAIGPGVVVWAGWDPNIRAIGKVVKVQHKYNGKTITTAYFHHSKITVTKGQVVQTGDKLGEVGTTGNSTGNHLHFEVWMGTSGSLSMDPEVFMRDNAFVTMGENETVASSPDSSLADIYGDDELAQEIAEYCELNKPDPDASYPAGQGAGPWGGHSNGKIPASQLKSIPWATYHKLRPDATNALIELNKEFRARFGFDIGITDSYRDYAGQVACRKAKGNLCATPGRSNHGWGLALDLASNINEFGTETHKWMQKNAPRFGWANPGWAQINGSKPEAWHWEFMGVAGGDANADGRTPAGAKQLARAMIGQYNWNETEFQCLEKLWTRESQWTYTAKNPSSGAYGIPQSLPGSKMGSVAADWQTNPATQITWGLKYIKQRYSTPCAAWAHSEKENWY